MCSLSFSFRYIFFVSAILKETENILAEQTKSSTVPNLYGTSFVVSIKTLLFSPQIMSQNKSAFAIISKLIRLMVKIKETVCS